LLITIEGGYTHGHGEQVATAPTAFVPTSESRLMTLLGKTVSRAEGTADGTLTLWFGDGQHFRCFDRPHYEAYQIRHGMREIIV
jgi:Family of unknown function (DUF6188)